MISMTMTMTKEVPAYCLRGRQLVVVRGVFS